MEAPGYIHSLRSQDFTFQLKKSAKPLSTLTDMARKHLYEDYLYLQTEEQKRRVEELKMGGKIDNRGKGSFDGKLLAAHYQISLPAMYAIVKRGRTSPDTAAKKRPGRKKMMTFSMVEHVVKTDQLAGGTALHTLHGMLEQDPTPGYQTHYRGRVISTPSIYTLSKLKKAPEVVVKKLRVVPMITEQNAAERLDWCENNVLEMPSLIEDRVEFCRQLESWVDVDETILTYSFGTGRIMVLRRGETPDEEEDQLTIRDELKSNPPSILLFSAVTCPRLLNPETCMEEGAEFDPKRKGIVQVRRVRGEGVYKRKTKYNEAGDAKFSDITVTGRTYGYMMANETNGLTSYLKRYHEGDEDQNRCCAAGIPIEISTTKEDTKPRGKRDIILNMHFNTQTQDSEYLASANYVSDSEDSECEEEEDLFEYAGSRYRVQQDNAGGHGFNNFQSGAGRRRSKTHGDNHGRTRLGRLLPAPQLSLHQHERLGFLPLLEGVYEG